MPCKAQMKDGKEVTYNVAALQPAGARNEQREIQVVFSRRAFDLRLHHEKVAPTFLEKPCVHRDPHRSTGVVKWQPMAPAG
jgi:hypothetical protein